ncbi:phosphoribosyl-dephospho-CoA transferase [Paraburkholderia sp. BL23I1N1]|uniref:malonate decarboxylase holo-ACP synthase n=1 Tax=Paraburkholderia sp. BL23I1N1 TaxID=1938802 RepID=UPI000E76E420|nr:malonate decarboxylase holo-ACP synthase [Paraburkholderia sp. BL23I1N1]RKE39381.1 phosphoribosyl-dephospho-CoA transferase [Paraburkholderia sp. BL23I1N1]
MQICAARPFAADHASSREARWRPHDLLRLNHLRQFDGEPAWIHESFERAPYAVVRRAPAADGFVAIGLRGVERSQRYGTWAHLDDIESLVPPEALARHSPLAERNALPAFAALAALQRDAVGALTGFVWGPTGSTGFELTTQVPTVTLSSDLDLLIRAPEKISHDTAMQLLNHLQAIAHRVGIRVDAQLETPAGGIALVEWATSKARVMARHARGPQLVIDPWAPAHGDA